MALADQHWCPTSVQVTVLQARGLRIKGKSGTNDAYALMQVGKEKYQTSVAEKSVAPVWKEEAVFDLPQLQHGAGGGGGTERSTLHVHVLHRALVGPDKLLGQAVINLVHLSQDRSRNKTEWFKLLDKTGKADKDRGEVLVDIQFMRNNMTASMFDLSAAGKSRSRLGKFKDKVRGKKKESDAASTVVPSFPQVLMDSEEEDDEGEVAAGKDEKKKKKTMKSLFSPKSNLQRNMSQSMSVLPAKNLSQSSSQSSGLNVDSSEGKKKFKFKIHKRSGSSDSSSSLGQQKHGTAEQSNLCINGSHIYCDEPPPRASRIGSNFSLASSGHGSMEDVPESSTPSVDSLQAARQYSPWTEEEEEAAEVENVTEKEGEQREEEEEVTMKKEKIREREEEDRIRMEEELAQEVRRRQEEEHKLAEEKRKVEEEARRNEEERVKKEEEERILREERERAQEEKRRQVEEEKARRQEEEEKARRQEEEEEARRQEEEEKARRQEEEEEARRQEEEKARRKEEEQKRLAEEKRKLEEEEKRRLEEERVRKEEEERLRRHEEERKRIEEEKRKIEEEERRAEEERIQEEKQRQEEEQKMIAEEKRRLEEEERRRDEEEKAQKEEEERARLEEERARRQEEEQKRIAEEKRRLGEEERRRDEEEKARKEEEKRIQEERRRQEEERARGQEEERKRIAEEKRRLEEEERRRDEEERAKKEEEERARLEEERIQKERRRQEEYQEKMRLVEQERRQREAEEKRKLEEEERKRMEAEDKLKEEKKRRNEERKKMEEEQERRRIEEEETRLREEEERIRKEEERKQEEERAMKEKEENKRLEEEKRKVEEEEKIRKETAKRRQEEEKKQLVEEEAEKLEKEKSAAFTSTNPFSEDDPDSPAGADSSAATESSVQQRGQPAVSLLGSSPTSSDEKDPVSTQREKRPAPQPPGRNQESHGPAQHLAQITKQSTDIKTVSVPPQRSVQMITPLSRSPTDTKTNQGLKQGSTSKGVINEAKHSKRPAPSRPCSVVEEPSPGHKTGSSLHVKLPNKRSSEVKREPVVYGLNPFEDDEDEVCSQDEVTTNVGLKQWPPAASQDAAAQAKIKSSKKAHAPPLPATTVTQNAEGNRTQDTGGNAPENSATHPCDPKHVPETTKEGPPPASRRLQPVKPLNPQRQPPVSLVGGELDKKSSEIIVEMNEKTKVNDSGQKGPYSQLTKAELISLVLKQEIQLSDRDKKIAELEQYIDNLLVRVMEESPNILLSMNSLKKTA